MPISVDVLLVRKSGFDAGMKNNFTVIEAYTLYEIEVNNLTLSKRVKLAEECAEVPVLRQIVRQVDPRARQRHHQVGNGKIDDIEIGGSPHSAVFPNRENNGQISEQCNEQN